MLMITPEAMRLLRGSLGAALVSRAVPVTLAGLQPTKQRDRKSQERELDRKRKESITTSCATILGRGTASAFEFEAACRHGVRQTLCLEGWSWEDADTSARKVVSAALTRIGAVRPTHWQGQPQNEWGDFLERRLCVHCGDKIPDIRKLRGRRNGRTVRFCSNSCSSAEDSNRTVAEWLAFASSRKEHAKTLRMRDCEQCGELFLPTGDAKKYCSVACNGLAQRALRQPIPCPQCRVNFVPSKARQIYCSNTCVVASKVVHAERPCETCGTIFKPGTGGTGTYCSRACRYQGQRKSRPEVACKWCSSIFTAPRSWNLPSYCSRSCVARARNAGMRGIICEAVS